MQAHLGLLVAGLTGQYGTVGLYGALQRLLLALALVAAPTCCFIGEAVSHSSTVRADRRLC